MNEKIIQQIELVDWDNPESVVSFYEENTLYFDNYDLIKDIDTIFEIANIKLAYIESLETKKRYKKADKYLRHVDVLIQKLKDHIEFEKLNERYYFAFGVISQRLKRLEDSQTYFKKLIKIDPENDLYSEWLKDNKQSIFQKKSYIIGYIGFGLVFLDMFLDGIFNSGFGENFYLYGFSIMLIGFYLPALIRQLKRFNEKIKK